MGDASTKMMNKAWSVAGKCVRISDDVYNLLQRIGESLFGYRCCGG